MISHHLVNLGDLRVSTIPYAEYVAIIGIAVCLNKARGKLIEIWTAKCVHSYAPNQTI